VKLEIEKLKKMGKCSGTKNFNARIICRTTQIKVKCLAENLLPGKRFAFENF